MMENNSEHFKSYDSLIPKVEELLLRINENDKKIEMTKNGFLQFVNETKIKMAELVNKYNDILEQHKQLISSLHNNNNDNNVPNKNQIEYNFEMNEKITNLNNSMNAIENEMKILQDKLDQSFNEKIDELKAFYQEQLRQQEQQQQQQQEASQSSIEIDEKLLSNENTKELIKIINELINDKISQVLYNQDSVGKPDYALYVLGARIIHDPLYTSETYQPEENKNLLHKIATRFGLGLKPNSPEIVIQVYISLFIEYIAVSYNWRLLGF